MLSVESLSFGFPGRVIGRGVDFALPAGEVLCVLGPNGGGKTTLLRTLVGLLPAHSGRIVLAGEPLERLSRGEVARRVGYVPQGHAGAFAYTLAELVLMGRAPYLGAFEAPGDRDRAIAGRALETLGISHLADRPVNGISGGERQLAMVARALAQEPRTLVMDEPTAGLDFGNQVRVLARIDALAAEGITVVFSTHDPDHAFRHATQALLLGEGRALEIGLPAQVLRDDSLERLYGVPVRVVALDDGAHACLPASAR